MITAWLISPVLPPVLDNSRSCNFIVFKKEHYQNMLEQTRKLLGPEDADVLGFGNNLALGYYSLGRYNEAIRLDEETLSIRERVLGPEHPDTLESRSNLAIGYLLGAL